jgi:diguanylate cyclase (GGDEF)-like protein
MEARRHCLIDDLTSLYNRRGFRALAEQQLRVASRINEAVLLFFVDVDGLKFVNDNYGHNAGDELLTGVAAILRHTFRESDLIARIGGDEFAVLTMETAPNSSIRLLDRLESNIRANNKISTWPFSMSLSVGVSRYNLRTSDTVGSLLERADKDMYNRKKVKKGIKT